MDPLPRGFFSPIFPLYDTKIGDKSVSSLQKGCSLQSDSISQFSHPILILVGHLTDIIGVIGKTQVNRKDQISPDLSTILVQQMALWRKLNFHLYQ